MNYPSDFPITDVQFAVQTIRDGTISTNRKPFAKSLWLVEGYALSKIVGEDIPQTLTSGPPLTDEEACNFLSSLLPNDNLTSIAIPWRELLKWSTKLLLTLL